MTLGLLGRKIGMTTVFDKEGLAVPVTVLQLGDNLVTQKMTKQSHGYDAVQVGGFKAAEKRLNKPELGHFKKHDLPPLKPVKEFRVEDASSFNVGDAVPLDSILKEGALVDVRGKSIGKGFQGRIKRWNGGRGPMSHGSKFHRSQGSIGAGTTPGRVHKGSPMPGRMGNEIVCTRKLTVVQLDVEKKIVLIRGSVPGVEGGLLEITPSRTSWNPPAGKARR
jgi:large subunit ribosomal protein L3